MSGFDLAMKVGMIVDGAQVIDAPAVLMAPCRQEHRAPCMQMTEATGLRDQ